jgi:site-specific recombinase XerD
VPQRLEQQHTRIYVKDYSLRTESAYLRWMKEYITFHKKRHPAEMGTPDVIQFLTRLAVNRKVAASTQNQALSALLFLSSHYVILFISLIGVGGEPCFTSTAASVPRYQN